MSSLTEIKNRNLFEVDNARDLTRRELVNTFVETQDFKRLLSSKNHIILGERGSGKTALAKMLSHDHLSLLPVDYAQQAINEKSFIGMYVSIKAEWVSGLKNKPWQNDEEKESFFQWRLNVAVCQAFLRTLRSCLDIYIDNIGERVIIERKLISEISSSWSEDQYNTSSIIDLQRYLEDIEHKRQLQLARKRVNGGLREGEEFVGLAFDVELFEPLRRGIILTGRNLELPEDSKWLLCLDEAEALDESHHRILNTYLRTDSGNLVFKITTTPYSHYTQDTNSGTPLVHGHDYEYVYIDRIPLFQDEELVNKLFEKRAKLSAPEYQEITLEKLLGRSKLLKPKDSDWTADSEEMVLLKKYANKSTYERALKLLNSNKSTFRDSISRKLHGALILRQAVESKRGHTKLDIYSGVEIVLRCGDSNPRRLVRIFNSLLLSLKNDYNESAIPLISQKKQTDILIEFSTDTLERTKVLPKYGPHLYDTVKAIGDYMSNSLHNLPLASNLILAVEIDKNISDKDWEVVERAVEWGFLYPIRSNNTPDLLPRKEGKFHLAYVLAPHFLLLPRKGESRKLSTMLKSPRTMLPFDDENLTLFEYLPNGI